MINIKIAPSTRCSGIDSIYLSFPYSHDIVEIVRKCPSRYWDRDAKQWELPYQYLDEITNMFENNNLNYSVVGNPTVTRNENPMPFDFKFKTKPFKHQIEGFEYGMTYDSWLLGDEQGLGKALALDTKIYTPEGFKLMKDIEVGDFVMGKDGKPTKVLATFDHSNVSMYRITFSDGVEIDCCKDHLWEINTQHGKKIVDTQWFMQKDQFGKPRNENLFSGGSYKYWIDRCGPVQFTAKDISLNPYLVGSLADEYTFPNEYLYNSVENRLQMARGLSAACGEVLCNGDVKLTRISERTLPSVLELFESLGRLCTYSATSAENGLKTTNTAHFDITVHSANTESGFVRGIQSIQRIENADAKCITVDNKDALYLAEHFVVTHNTKQVIDIAVAKKLQYGYEHCLIICGVNGLKWNWVNEISTHSNEKSHILGQKTRKGKTVIGSTKDKIKDLENIGDIDAYFLITNVESFRTKEVSDNVKNLCDLGIIGLVAIDEFHKIKNPSTQQGKGVLKIQPKHRIAMTGTPLMNNPLDLYMILKWLGYEKHPFYKFKNHYCILGGFGGYEVVGYRNLSELSYQLDEIMLRRLKSDVLDLPEKLHINEFVEMSGKQAQIYKEVEMNIKANIDQIKMVHNPLAELIRLRQATGYTGILSSTIQESAKLDRMQELVTEAVDNGKKVVIFSNWLQMVHPILESVSAYNPAVITGEIDADTRQQMVDKFQNDDSCRVIVGTIGAMGTGLTLTAGTVEIFMDEPWTMANKQQAEDRCHRVGTTENVTIYTIMCKDTIDERIHEIVENKGQIADILVDKKGGKSSVELLNFLLS